MQLSCYALQSNFTCFHVIHHEKPPAHQGSGLSVEWTRVHARCLSACRHNAPPATGQLHDGGWYWHTDTALPCLETTALSRPEESVRVSTWARWGFSLWTQALQRHDRSLSTNWKSQAQTLNEKPGNNQQLQTSACEIKTLQFNMNKYPPA